MRKVIFLTSAAAWLLLVTRFGGGANHSGAAGTHALMHGSLRAARPAMLIARYTTEWAVMIAAMMGPALMEPLDYIHQHSFASRRGRSMLAFVAGYGSAWMLIGWALLGLLTLVEFAARRWHLLPAGFMIVTIVWQCSPIKQRCLNRCHAQYPLPVFGVAAEFGACRFGLAHGMWCVGSCWAVMALPMLLPTGRAAVMAVGTLLVFSERLEHPAPLAWRWRGFGRLSRLLIARARIRLAPLVRARDQC